jgi:translation initiation factor 1
MSERKKRKGIVYSTDPGYNYEYENNPEPETLPPEKQDLRVSLDRKQRKGKTVTLITGFTGTKSDLEQLARTIKNSCGTGGSAKDGEIIIQGDKKEQVGKILDSKGYRYKFSGG